MKPKIDSGQLVVIEGCDNVGKSTVIKLLEGHLRSKKLPVHVLAFPGNQEGTLGKWVYELHHSPQGCEMNQSSLQVLHISAHIDCIESQIKPLLSAGNLVVLDRYWWSTWVYGTVAGIDQKHLQNMIDLELGFWGDVSPDCVLWVRRQEIEVSPPSKLLVKEYASLAVREKLNHPVIEIHNDTTLDVVLEQIDSKLRAIGIVE